MGKWMDTNFKGNLALVVSYHPAKFQIDQIKHLQVRVWKPKYLGYEHTPKRPNTPTPILKATKSRWCPINLLSFKLIRLSIFELESGNQNVDWQMDGRTAGHINLIVRLVTGNLPNLRKKLHWACAELRSFFL